MVRHASMAGMTMRPIDLRVLELLTARLCHDLIGPVAAIANGVELLGEDDPDFVRDAVALVGDSAHKANARLQFYRFAYGFRGGGLTGPAPHQLAAEYFAETAIECDYGAEARTMRVERQKLGCLMLAVAGEGLPRGGRLSLSVGDTGPRVDASGEGTGPSPDSRIALLLKTPIDGLTTRTVGAYFAGLIAEAQGLRLKTVDAPGGFRLVTEPIGA
jgi:histidine phosphotransferase ChpT